MSFRLFSYLFHTSYILLSFLIRAIWPGDMGIALATSFLTIPPSFSSNSSSSPIRNALATLFTKINPTTGALPESGPPLSQTGSDTYHMWTVIGVYEYYLWSGDAEFVQEIWGNYVGSCAFLHCVIRSSILCLYYPSDESSSIRSE